MKRETINTDERIHKDISTEYKKMVTLSDRPKILICTPEVTALPEGMGNAANLVSAKGGGLGDISASLIRNLNENKNYDLHVVLPKYDSKIKHVAAITNQEIDRLAVVLSGKGIHLVNDSAFSYLSNPYDEGTIHSPVRRSLAYQRHVINLLLDYLQPDIVHCNDWMTGLIPSAARSKGIKSLFTLHNIFTEKQTMRNIELSGIRPMDFMNWLYFEEFPDNSRENWESTFKTNKVDFTASAVFAADEFNTVSESFLEELYNNDFPDIVSKPLYEVIKRKYEDGRASGILNAPNDTVSPKVLPGIINFNKHTLKENKALNKKIFQSKMKLPVNPDIPLFFWPNRLYYQKGPDILVDNYKEVFSKYKLQIAFIANGDSKIEEKLKKLGTKYSNLAFVNFNEELSNLGKAAADFILMPSRYEPCGLPQMEALRFGTLPVVRSTGGLKDTIFQLDVEKHTGNGFTFKIADRAGLEYGIKEALKFYKLPETTRIKQLQRIMSESKRKFNLKHTAEKYIKIYDKLIKESKDNK
ncbi:MAG: glycogen/starch synthase [Candidatus Cloacimonetes bacterium]|nr:glycogen/starch synthase [Candidatus Cloacimonadota bacterium]